MGTSSCSLSDECPTMSFDKSSVEAKIFRHARGGFFFTPKMSDPNHCKPLMKICLHRWIQARTTRTMMNLLAIYTSYSCLHFLAAGLRRSSRGGPGWVSSLRNIDQKVVPCKAEQWPTEVLNSPHSHPKFPILQKTALTTNPLGRGGGSSWSPAKPRLQKQ